MVFQAAGRRAGDDDDDFEYREGYGKSYGHKHKRKGFLGELFDFD